MAKRQKTLLEKILLSFIPYTEENLMLAYKPWKFFASLEREYSVSKNAISVATYRAKKYGYLKEVEDKHSEKQLFVTSKGKVKILGYIKKAPKAWDGKWRLIFFDIPEKEKRKRNIFRSKLKELGFKQHQLSAWISPFDFSDEIDLLIAELEIEDYVKYLIGDTVRGEKELKKLFNLK